MLPLHKIHLRVIVPLVMALMVAEPAVAAALVSEAPSVTVTYHDLDLSSPEGIAGLYERIHGAAVDVCNSVEGRPNRWFGGH